MFNLTNNTNSHSHKSNQIQTVNTQVLVIGAGPGLWFFFYTETEIVWFSQPVIRKDAQNRPHSERGPAFKFLGLREYFWHGVFIADSRVVDAPETLSATEIESEKNAEVRRVMIERFGQARFLLESGAKEIHRDDFGSLFLKEVPGDEPLVMVKVVNSTPEPDGQFKDYFLRVPPTMQRARQAVAWTFNLEENDYDPCLQT